MLARPPTWAIRLCLLDALEQILQRLTLGVGVVCVEVRGKNPCENLTDTHSRAEVVVVHASAIEAATQFGVLPEKLAAVVVVVEDVEQVIEQVLLVADVSVASLGALDGVCSCWSHVFVY